MNRTGLQNISRRGEPLVFLFDERSRIERRLLQKFVGGNFDIAKVKTLHLSFANTKSADKSAERLTHFLEQGETQYLVPLRITWWVKRGQEFRPKASLKDMFVSAVDRQNWLKQRLLLHGLIKQDGTNAYEIVMGEGASTTELEIRFDRHDRDISFPRFVARSAFLSLERAERAIKGSRYKIPRLVEKEVLERPQLRATLEEIADNSGRSMEALRKESAACLKEMAATPTPEGLDLVAALGRAMYTRGFDRELDYLEDDLTRVKSLLRDRPVAFVFSHKTHVDGFLLYALFHDFNLPPVHTFGGINMGFAGLGTMLRNAGAIFIRRSFGDDRVYKAVFRNYIDYLASNRFPINWALEGTRSRTGKLMPPRFGLLSYVVGSYLRENDPDLVIVPISIVYDQIPEVVDYDHLQIGGIKRPESAVWFLEYFRGLKKQLGRIHIRFGAGVTLKNYLGPDGSATAIERGQLQKLAFDLSVDVNNVTPITLNSLICYALLEQGHRAISSNQLQEELEKLLAFIAIYGFAITTELVDMDEERLELALQQLADTGAIEVAKEGIDVLYLVPHGGARIPAYYRNGLIQFFVTSAVGELALMSVRSNGASAIEEFRSEALRIRDLMKYEFFFEGSQPFIKLLEGQFDQRISNWRARVQEGPSSIRAVLAQQPLLLGHGTLRPFIEAYLILCKSLSMIPEDKDVDTKRLVKRAVAVGQQGVLQQRVHCEESVSQAYFENAIKFANGRGILSGSAQKGNRREDLYLEVEILASSCRVLATIADSHRYDYLPKKP